MSNKKVIVLSLSPETVEQLKLAAEKEGSFSVQELLRRMIAEYLKDFSRRMFGYYGSGQKSGLASGSAGLKKETQAEFYLRRRKELEALSDDDLNAYLRSIGFLKPEIIDEMGNREFYALITDKESGVRTMKHIIYPSGKDKPSTYSDTWDWSSVFNNLKKEKLL